MRVAGAQSLVCTADLLMQEHQALLWQQWQLWQLDTLPVASLACMCERKEIHKGLYLRVQQQLHSQALLVFTPV